MEDLDKLKKDIKKINLHCGDRVCFGHEKAIEQILTTIRQREKDLLKEQCSHYKLKRTTGDMCLKCNVLFQPFGGVEQPKGGTI